MKGSSEIHPTACVDASARLGAGCRVGPFAVIEGEVEVGEGCRIGAHAVIKRYTRMGRENRVFEGAVLGGIPQDRKFRDARSALRIGDRNVFREGVTVNRSTAEGGVTTLGDDNFLMTHSHVAHECVLGSGVVMANCVALAGHVHLQDGAFLSGGVVVHQFSRIGRHAMVGGNAKVVQDVLPFCLADGVPARLRGLNLVGLQRSGFEPGEIAALKRAYRILARQGLKLAEKLPLLDALESPPVAQLAGFIRGSERGFCRVG